jgi:hypothetical protein
MKTFRIPAAMIAVAILALAGCAPLAPRLDGGFGQSVRLAVRAQTLDGAAVARNAAKDASGIDGAAAKEAIERYQKSFRAPEAPTSVFTIGVSGNGVGR